MYNLKLLCISISFCVCTSFKTSRISSFLGDEQLNVGIVKATDKFVWKSQPCMYLEPENVTHVEETWVTYKKVNYRYQELRNGTLVPPPIGIRSAVPLGGISTGSIELRSDGSFHEWTVFNQHPAGAAKIPTFDDAFFGIRVEKKGSDGKEKPLIFESDVVSMLLRTHPPKDLPAVESLKYTGFYPIASLEVIDSRLPVNIAVVAMSAYSIGNMNRSATPAISFLVEVQNPSPTETFEVSVMLNMPLGMDQNQQRLHVPKTNHGKDHIYKKSKSDIFKEKYKTMDEEFQDVNPGKRYKRQAVQTDLECMHLCTAVEQCQSWTYFKSEQSCAIFTSINLNGFSEDASSGVKGEWNVNNIDYIHCLTQNRPGFGAPSGNMSICVNASYGGVVTDVSFGLSNDVTELWKEFSSSGNFANIPAKTGIYVNGAAATTITAGPEVRTAALMYLSWYYPNRDFSDKIYGNWYKHLFDNSEDVVKSIDRDGVGLAANISGLHGAFMSTYQPGRSTLPVWLTDILVNSLSHIRSAMWWADGRWRQWEAYDCTNMDSVHNDGERHIPYIHFFPDSTKNKMIAWAKSQLDNGMIQEQLLLGCNIIFNNATFDRPGGRVMSDVSSMFMVYLYELYRWTNDTDILKQLYPNAKKAGQWHINISKDVGLPKRLVNTYDVLGQEHYDLCAYNGAFHLLAMRVGMELAIIMGDDDFKEECQQSFEIGQVALDKYLWNDTHNYYNSYLNDSSSPEKNPGAIMTDTFYSQVLADTLGLGPLISKPSRLSLHLDAELKKNDSPYGMLVQTGRYKYPGPPQDNAVWMMGNPNWASTKIRLGHDVRHAFDVAKKALDNYRTTVNDLWNIAGITGGIGYGADGQPYGTSHYGYFMSSWHLIFAITGQQVNLPEDYITFDPKTPTPYSYPVIIPGIVGYLTGSKQGKLDYYTLTVTVGHLRIGQLSVSGTLHPGGINLREGQSVSWKQIK